MNLPMNKEEEKMFEEAYEKFRKQYETEPMDAISARLRAVLNMARVAAQIDALTPAFRSYRKALIYLFNDWTTYP